MVAEHMVARHLALVWAVGCAALLVACGSSDPPVAHRQASRALLTVGQPIAPRDAPALHATVELMISPARTGEPVVRLAIHRAHGQDPRDLCTLALTRSRGRLTTTDSQCDVRAPGEAAVFASTQADASTLITGIAPRDITAVTIAGPGAIRRSLPLSRHGAFLARYASGTYGRVRVIARRRS